MKPIFITLAATGAIALGGFIFAETDGSHCFGGRSHGGQGFALERLTRGLDLTADQQARVQPIIDQARPQIIAIHQEAMQKTHTVMNGAMSQIRPLLTADQQKKLDDMQKAREEMRDAHKNLRNTINK